ncbi:hypothetical protein [Salsuginibacillus kocurii]|uniref:hypothetical protein n=1 Tax=Salsuginibacillus kocurii TaxID=427078 RepID=UPI000373089D|nr:hypothetical protein [Salsuginibacillus kocurii]
MAENLSVAQREFLLRYQDWLKTVEEGISTVVGFYREGFVEEGDRLLTQMMAGFVPFDASNMTLRSIFALEEETEQQLLRFDEMVKKAQQITELTSAEERLVFISREVMPVFQSWKVLVFQTVARFQEDGSEHNGWMDSRDT